MQSTEEKTSPRRSDIFPDDDNSGVGPGCVVWGIIGMMLLGMACISVLLAAEAGVRQGARVGQRTAVARTQEWIGRECEVLPTDIAAGRVEIVRARYDNWAQQGVIPICAGAYVEAATQIYVDSLATETPTSTETPLPTLTATPLPTAVPQIIEATATATPENTSPYDLAGLLQEARDYMANNNYEEAIRTLDAIAALDPSYEPGAVNQLRFSALTNRATFLYRNGGSLAEAIQLTNRAEQYGDVGDLGFERTIAQYYLDAQGFLDVSYGAAIQQLNLVRGLAPNYRNTNRLLVEQMEGYGDKLLLDGDACRAVQQFDALLGIQQQPNVQVKREQAQAQCSGTAVTIDPNATPDPNQPVVPTATPTTSIAPVGQPGG